VLKAEEKYMKKVLVILAIVAMCGSIAQAGYQSGSCSGTLSINFSNASFVGGHGWSSGSSRTISWSGWCNGCHWGPNVYGWASGPTEYYIGRSGGTNCGSYSTSKGNFTLYTNSCNGPNITGNGWFQQYNASGNGSSGQNMGQHSNGWSSRGKGVNMGNGYQVVSVENYGGGSGNASISTSGGNWYTLWWGSGSVSSSCGGGGGGSTTTTTSGGGGGSYTVSIRMRGTTGSEHAYCLVGGSSIGSWNLGTGFRTYQASTTRSGGICVGFDNDNGSRDVQVDCIWLPNGQFQAESQSYNTGVWQNNKCGGSNSEWLHCNGCIGFSAYR
jgi:endo-1,4-beta-xylanase